MPTLLCLASYDKGQTFLAEARALGARVLLLTLEKLAGVYPEGLYDARYFMPDLYHRQDVMSGVSYLARSERIDRIIPLDEFDLEMAAALREHLQLPGMGETLTRRFRDKLAMRVRAEQTGLAVPAFTRVFNDAEVADYLAQTPAPWLLKPRSEASAIGIKKLDQAEQVWRAFDELGDRRSQFVLEQFIPGQVYHADAVVFDGQVAFVEVHRYATPPFEVMHRGGLFCSRTVLRDGEDDRLLRALLRHLVTAFEFGHGVLHSEFIKAADGRFYFLEVAARVGGANIVDMVEAATGVNLWREWARLELAAISGARYTPPQPRQDYAAVLISLARQEWPDLAAYADPEVVWRLDKRHHAGLIVKSADSARIDALLADYMPRFYHDFYTSLPPPDKPTA